MTDGWRLRSLQVENFRSIAGQWEIPLDADVILVHGPNGSGKTSLLTAIELGATGGVGSSDDRSSQSDGHLVNRRYPLGRVNLLLENGASTRNGSFEISRQGRTGNPALSPAERADFVERGYLPQTKLGRLLESYETSERSVDNSLVRFVKDLVGLDRLDAIINGLNAAGHLARVRSAVPLWGGVDRDLETVEKELGLVRVQLGAARAIEKDIEQSVRDLLPNSSVDAGWDAELETARLLEQPLMAAAEGLKRLEGQRVRLDGVRIAVTADAPEGSLDAEQSLAETALRAREAFERWEAGSGHEGLQRINELRLSLGLAEVQSGQLFEGFAELQGRLELLLTRDQRARDELERRDVTITQIRSQLDALLVEEQNLQSRLDDFELPGDSRALMVLLQAAMPLIHSDACPVCDQSFPGGAPALVGHVEAKVTRASNEANDFAHVIGQIEDLRLRKTSAVSALSALEQAPVFTSDGPDSAALVRDLNALSDIIRLGEVLLHDMERSQARAADVSARRSALVVAEQRLGLLLRELELHRTEEPLATELERVSEYLHEQITDAQYRASRGERLRELLREYDSQSIRTRVLMDRDVALEASLASQRERLAEATRRKNSANKLRLEAERVRTRLVDEVFDAALNESWAEFFTRFVPGEPFVPRFKKQKQGARSVDVQLDTVSPDGTPYGSPGSVLSFGNANTAALSLFLALHMAAPTSVDWLVFDDPVQSMDDIHVANFAAVMRQLTVAHKRQIVIAVHQRELFDYLAFELAPAAEGASLLKVRIERTGESSTVTTERVSYVAERAIRAGGQG